MSGSFLHGRELSGSRHFSVDVVVVGSGASGSVVATKLAQAGHEVLVLEEGEHVEPERYQKMRPTQSLKTLWREGGMTAAIGIGDTPIINVTMGRCVGGSSVLTGGVCFRTPEHILDHWVTQRGLRDFSPGAMEPFFEEVERFTHVEEVPTNMRSRSTELWAQGAAKRGIEVKPTRRNTRGCDGCGRCNFGCPEGAKMSVDIAYLPHAIRAGASVLSDCLVERVLLDGAKAVGVQGWLLDRDGSRRDHVTVHARRVVLAAGAVHTPLILKDSGISGKSGQVGRNMTLHPAFRMTALFDEPVRGWQGALQSAYTDAFEDRDVTLISVFIPPFAMASGIPGFGPSFMGRAGQMDHLAMFGGLVHDDAGGRVWRVPLAREPVMTYRMSKKDRAAIPLVVRELGEAFLEAGARELFLPILGHPPVDADAFRKLDLERIPARRFECSSQHPMGTCRIGTRPDHSVADSEGRVWDVEQLYVVDGSTVPTSLGVNPQLTIMAMATRFASRMLDHSV